MPTVLFIDDQTCGSQHLIHSPKAAGYDVCVAAEGDEALRLFRLFPVDVIVMDCRVCDPKNASADPAAAFKQMSPDVPIIMMSAYYRVPCRRMLNADACLEKGQSDRHLLNTIQLMLYARHYGLCRSVPA